MPKSKVEELKQEFLAKGFKTRISPEAPEGIYFFLSFDLVNSTLVKNANPKIWPLVIHRFYELIKSQISNRLTILIWKHVGDEILFYKEITCVTQFCNIIPNAFEVQLLTIEVLYKEFPETKSLLSVKATAWIAFAKYLAPAEISEIRNTNINDNIIISTQNASGGISRDFLGPDIDIGFRISKFASQKRLVVSANLAYFIFKARQKLKSLANNLKIVSYEQLKGIWDGRRYPIIWFEKDWKSIQESFLYDECFNVPIVDRIMEGFKPEQISKIYQIYDDLGMVDELDRIYGKLINKLTSANQSPIEITIPIEKTAEVHCVAVCIDINGRILAARRPLSKKRFPGCLEFGCGQLRLGESISKCLKRTYKEDFGVEIQLPDNPIPIGTYHINDKEEQRTIPGIIVVAQIMNPEGVENCFSKQKHSEIKWLDGKQFKFDSSEKYVPGFLETINNAYKTWLRIVNK